MTPLTPLRSPVERERTQPLGQHAEEGISEYVTHGGQHAEAWIPLRAEYKSK